MVFVADKRYYVNHAHTEIVDEDNPGGAQLLVAEGGILTDEDAAAWGLGDAAPTSGVKPSPEQAQANVQRGAKAQTGSKNKAQSSPDATKAEESTPFSEASFSAGQPQNAVSGADAPAPDIQPVPKTE